MDVVVADGAPGGRLAASPECPRRRSGSGAAPADRSVRARPGSSLCVRGRPAPPPRRPCPRPPRPVPLAELHARLARNRGGPSRQAQTAGPAGRWPPPPLQHRPHRPRGRRGRQRGSARRNRREPHTRSVDAPSLAERVLTASERDRWRSRPASCRQAALLHLWTCKEAFLKATGEGLRRAPTTVESIADGSTVVALRDAPGSSAPSSAPADEWSVRPFSATDGVLGAIVRKGTMPSPVSWVDATDIVTRSAE